MVKFDRDASKHYIQNEECEQDYIESIFKKKPDASVEYYCSINDTHDLIALLNIKEHFAKNGHPTKIETSEMDQVFIQIGPIM